MKDTHTPSQPQRHAVSRQDVNEAIAEYMKTLHALGKRRNPGAWEETAIYRAMAQFGPEMVKLACRGARFEPKREGFDPASYISLNRILDSQKIEWFANLGSGEPPESQGSEVDRVRSESASRDRELIQQGLDRLRKEDGSAQ